jgi:hypothetical protein
MDGGEPDCRPARRFSLGSWVRPWPRGRWRGRDRRRVWCAHRAPVVPPVAGRLCGGAHRRWRASEASADTRFSDCRSQSAAGSARALALSLHGPQSLAPPRGGEPPPRQLPARRQPMRFSSTVVCLSPPRATSARVPSSGIASNTRTVKREAGRPQPCLLPTAANYVYDAARYPTTEARVSDQQRYDVFLSHNRADADAVELVARRLRDEGGLRLFLDTWHLVPGEPWQEGLEQALAASASCAVFLGGAGLGTWDNEAMRAARARRAPARTCRCPRGRPPRGSGRRAAPRAGAESAPRGRRRRRRAPPRRPAGRGTGTRHRRRARLCRAPRP